MSPVMIRQWLMVLLLSSLAILGVMLVSKNTSLDFGDSVFRTLHTGVDPHVRISLNAGETRAKQFFVDTLQQAHQQLGEKRDTIDNFEENMLWARKGHVSTVCSQLKNNSLNRSVLAGLRYYKNAGILYCQVAKAASKFWSRMLHVLDTDDHISPFEFPSAGHEKLLEETEYMTQRQQTKYTREVLDSAFKIVFARNPYKRIYSSYLDKLLSPNSRFWKFGRGIVSLVRESPSDKSLECGHDVKFNELVKYLIAKDPEKYDRHFRPVSVTCDVCRVQYDVIGKVETFKHDVMYIINKTQVPEKEILFKDFSQENSIHYILFNAKRTFGLKKKCLKCASDHVIHIRLWRILQIAGLIEKYDSYPLSPEESSQANLTTITNLLLDAYHRSTSGARSNSKEAYLQAYSQVSLEDMEKLRLKYLKDFMLFDYDDRPDELFRRDSNFGKISDSFDYFDVLQLE